MELLLYLRALTLLCLENMQDMMKSESWSYMVDEFEWQKSAISVIDDVGRAFFIHFHVFVEDLCWMEILLLYLSAPTILGKYARYDEK